MPGVVLITLSTVKGSKAFEECLLSGLQGSGEAARGREATGAAIRIQAFYQGFVGFARTSADVLPKETAERMSALANRIGRSLQYGLTQFRGEQGAPPSLKPFKEI